MAQDLSLVPVPDTIFTNDELIDFLGQIRAREPHHIDILCGCTSSRYGDSQGLLRICDDGTITVICHCYEECKRVFNSPIDFVKHGSGASNVPNWRTKVWILDRHGKKIKVAKTCLLKYYRGDQYKRPRKEVAHRDQILPCSVCNKQRRFELRTKEACRFYHDALARKNRTCSDMIPGRWTCEDLEERITSRKRTGCVRDTKCMGCHHCSCVGCTMCRFDDCSCRDCIDFYANAPH